MKNMMELTPGKIVAELDKHIVGQERAKKAVAIALRNRWRRKNLQDKDLAQEIVPKNILMVGATGVGKTEIARRIAKITNSPFIKVEATKFTEIGYVGKDVEAIIRDLMDISVKMVRDKMRQDVEEQAKQKTFARLLKALNELKENTEISTEMSLEDFKDKMMNGELDEVTVEIEIDDHSNSNTQVPTFDIPGMPGGRGAMINIGEIFTKAIGKEKTKIVEVNLRDAYDLIIKEESDKIIDEDKIVKEAIELIESEGIVFLDEIDKIAGKSSGDRGEVSREGVQRDLLPLIEGTVVSTKYGSVKTDHILFIASGAFHIAKPYDLLPELQGRLPIRVELDNLTQEDLIKILTEPENNLIRQYTALLEIEGVKLDFEEEAIEKIAYFTKEINDNIENIGARRLHTMLEKLLEEVSFDAESHKGTIFTITQEYVDEKLGGLVYYDDLSKFIL